MIKLTYDRAVELLTEIVNEYGEDYVYPEDEMEHGQCQYHTESGEPSCLIGHLAFRLGVLDEVGEGDSAEDSLTRAGVYIQDRRVAILVTYAHRQDGLVPWGEALEFGKAQAERAVIAEYCQYEH